MVADPYLCNLAMPSVLWEYKIGGGGPHVSALMEHSYCMLEEQLEVGIIRKEVEQTTSVYLNSPVADLGFSKGGFQRALD